MPKIIISEEKCQPELCPRGICAAKKTCPFKCLIQYDPGEPPVGDSSHCNGCAICAKACPAQAISIV